MEVTVGSIPIYYEEHGTGIPIVMLHGTPVDHRWLMATWEKIFENHPGWRRIYPDLPGHGRTPGADWLTTQDQMLDIVTGFIDTLLPGQRFVVAGLSYGGYLSQGVVYRMSERLDGVCLWIPAIEQTKERVNVEQHQVLVEDAAFQAALPPSLGFVTDMAVVQSVELIDWFKAVGQPAFGLADWTFQGRIVDTPFSFEVDKLPAPVPAPALIVTGRQDAMVGYKPAWEILKNYPRATFAVLDRAGHLLDVEQASLLGALTIEWLGRVEEYISQNQPKH
ncbi:MAG: alpha/beta hydrolase [Chloroflexi bacterium]|nr:alpha/beta hydrolase [Chloroflexota bacterium]OJV97217.1 MAG: hypothetical protein BGO39_19545 [Chloroflexi bacterium 54-19]